ncbi:phage tail tape measure protein [Paraclostridium sordellii 8483]|uniref:phage tail tape measure protein n=1 Tax=Paraclostridium sordellii TaxID=1505 RepID=UPI0003114D27|nr:phage tail tape measure protein [Paeniclostridium sordellii]TAN64771.1 phage tail tape measure protein [Paeniclostridium sordellii 8483]
MSLNLGTATAYIDLDSSRFTSGLLKASKSLDATSREFRKNESEFNRLGTSINGNVGYFKKLDLASKSLGNQLKASQNTAKTYKTAIDDTSQAVKKAQSEHSALGQKMTVLQRSLKLSNQIYGEGSKQSQKYSKAISDIGQQQNKLESEIEKGNIAIEEFGIAMKGAETQATGLQKELKNFKLKQIGQDMTQLGKTLTANVTAPIVGLAGAATKSAVDFESAFAGVKKTVDASSEDMKKLEAGIRDMAKEMPTAATEIAGVAEAAGQLGIEVPNILGFTKTMVMLGDSTNMSAEEAATSLARLANITGMSQGDFDKLGSTIVALGNNMATTESEITAMGLRLAAAGSQVGMTEPQIMSFAAALSSVGIEAEAGGSAFSKVMISMQLATEKGGKKLEQFAEVAGMSSREFKRAFEEDASGAIMKFIEGLGSAEERGLSAIGILSDMGIEEVRLRDALLRAAGASDVFSEALGIGTKAWEENNALTNEAQQRYETTASKINILKNNFIDVGITIGDILIPYIQDFVKWIQGLVEKFQNLEPSTQDFIVKAGMMTAIVGPLLMVFGSLITSVTTISGALGSLGGMFGLTSGAAAGTGGAMAGASGAAAGLAGTLGPVLGVALLGIIAKIGDNENALLKLQEKFGGLGTVIGGVCEFISGVVQLTFGNLAIAIMGVFDIIAAIIDGPGGATVNDAVDKMTAKMKLNTEEAMGKMVLTTTRGMSQMRNATDEQLNGTVESMNTIMDAIPRIVDGKYRTASQALGQQLHNMDFTQLSILQGMNDTTKMIFQGIVEGMSVEQASKKVEQNLKEMAAAGKIDADNMQKDISQAMEHMKQQMDAKTKEGADKVNANTKNAEIQAVQNAQNTKDGVSKAYSETTSNIDRSTKEAGNKAKTNMDQASKDVGNATNNMANEAKKGTSKLASNTDADMKNANKAVQQSATDMYNGAKKSYSKLADVAKQEASRMHNGVRDSASAMSLKARQSASEMYRGVTTSTRLMANAAIADWNRIRSVYSQPIHGTVTKTTVLQTISQGPKSINEKLIDVSTFYKQKVHNFVNPEDNNINMKAYDIVKSNDIASYITSRISNYLDEKNKTDSEKENNNRKSNKKTQDINLTLHIEKFENRTDNDIEQLMEEIGFAINRKINLV